MKKVTAGNLAQWNGVNKTLSELIEWLEMKPHLDDRHSKLLSDLIVAHNNFIDSSAEEEAEFN